MGLGQEQGRKSVPKMRQSGGQSEAVGVGQNGCVVVTVTVGQGKGS